MLANVINIQKICMTRALSLRPMRLRAAFELGEAQFPLSESVIGLRSKYWSELARQGFFGRPAFRSYLAPSGCVKCLRTRSLHEWELPQALLRGSPGD